MKGHANWNSWRATNPTIVPDLQALILRFLRMYEIKRWFDGDISFYAADLHRTNLACLSQCESQAKRANLSWLEPNIRRVNESSGEGVNESSPKESAP
jgi:hypothetical protein